MVITINYSEFRRSKKLTVIYVSYHLVLIFTELSCRVSPMEVTRSAFIYFSQKIIYLFF